MDNFSKICFKKSCAKLTAYPLKINNMLNTQKRCKDKQKTIYKQFPQHLYILLYKLYIIY